MASRPALVALGVTTLASFAAGWWTGLSAKPRRTTPTAAATTAPEPRPAADDTFQTKILPFLKTYCLECHNGTKAAGGLTLDGYQSEAHARKNRKDWATVEHVLAAGEMPPKKKKQPTKDEKEFVITWVESTLTKVDCGVPQDPGRVTLRRLNRAEYNNTIRDLCGVDFKPADDFPADDVGYGFDNIGDVLSLQPVLLEKYLAAADKILSQALTIPQPVAASTQPYGGNNLKTLPRDALEVTRRPNGGQNYKIAFKTEGTAFPGNPTNFPETADYIIRFRGWGTKAGGAYPKVFIRVNDKDIKSFEVDAPRDKPKMYEARTRLPAGTAGIKVAFVNPFEDKEAKAFREFGLDRIEVDGPHNPEPKPLPASVQKLLIAKPGPALSKTAAAEAVLKDFATRAYRRPVRPEETARLVRLFTVADGQGEPFEKALQLPMKAALCSPHFLFRIEDDPKNPDGVRTLNDFEFATRLSYFLWSTMPDADLFRRAEAGELRKPGVLEQQVKRMLADPKSAALVENFAGQWLQLRMLKGLAPDKGTFPAWDDALARAMVREAELFFEHIVRTDRPVLDLLDADYTFVNDRLARHYGIPGVSGSQFRQVKMPDGRRGGVITMASTLTVTSNPTRTSPVKRGKWILENVLGTPPPPPAPDVPELPPTAELKGTLRQQMEQHRANPSCATCHAKLDPLGFGLENFDAIGGWRDTDNKQKIDASGVLPDGGQFDGPAELRKVLLGKSDLFRRCLAEKLLTYSLGRGLEYYDKCAVDDVVKRTSAGGDRFSALVLAIVQSDPFQKRKGKRSE